MNHSIERLLDVMERLRNPVGGCPWDIEQTFASITPHTIEEAYEVADAIERGDMVLLKEELGDLLLQVVFHAQMAREAGLFTFADVAAGIADKLVRRHPHVFGDATVANADDQLRAWEALKAGERTDQHAEHRPSALDGIATALPALTRANKLGGRAARVGFDWAEPAPVLAKIDEEIGELKAVLADADGTAATSDRIVEEMGDLLFSCVNLARKLKIDPETALRLANTKFERRFRRLESVLAAEGRTADGADADELDAVWRQVKALEAKGD